MRMVKIESGRDKGKSVITMNDEPQRKRPGPEPITTHNVNPLTREERRKAAAAKAEPEKKGGSK